MLALQWVGSLEGSCRRGCGACVPEPPIHMFCAPTEPPERKEMQANVPGRQQLQCMMVELSELNTCKSPDKETG